MAREEDYELVHRLRSADSGTREAAFDALVHKYQNRVFSLAARILNDKALASDAVQGTFLTVLRKSRKFRFRSAFSSWIYRVTVNQCIDLKRRRKRIPHLSLSEGEVVDLVGDQDRRRTPPTDPVEAARRIELRREIARAIARLDPRMSAVVLLRYAEGLDYREIAEILELPLGTVKSRLNRAHAALDADLGPRLDEFI